MATDTFDGNGQRGWICSPECSQVYPSLDNFM
jgi:hypothetical protein